MTARPLAAGLVGLVLASGCGSDDPVGAARDASAPGVTFAEDVTVPTDASGNLVTGQVTEPPGLGPDEVEIVPDDYPSDWPEDFPVPDDAIVDFGATGFVGGDRLLSADLTLADADPETIFAFFTDAVADHEVLRESSEMGNRGYIGRLTYRTPDYLGDVLVSEDGSGGVLLTLSATLPLAPE